MGIQTKHIHTQACKTEIVSPHVLVYGFRILEYVLKIATQYNAIWKKEKQIFKVSF